MFEKVTKFRMLPVRRYASDAIVPANDNRRIAVQGVVRRVRAPRPICRWELDASTNRPTSRWELAISDEPSPSLQRAPLLEQGIHRIVMQLSYLTKPPAAAVHGADIASDMCAPSRPMERHAKQRAVLHARH